MTTQSTRKIDTHVYEIEHDGDLDRAREELLAIDGISAVAFTDVDFDLEEARAICTTTLSLAEFKKALEDAEVC